MNFSWCLFNFYFPLLKNFLSGCFRLFHHTLRLFSLFIYISFAATVFGTWWDKFYSFYQSLFHWWIFISEGINKDFWLYFCATTYKFLCVAQEHLWHTDLLAVSCAILYHFSCKALAFCWLIGFASVFKILFLIHIQVIIIKSQWYWDWTTMNAKTVCETSS